MISVGLGLLTSCTQGSAKMQWVEKPGVAATVKLVFEKDGCRVYEFWHSGARRYYSDCRDK